MTEGELNLLPESELQRMVAAIMPDIATSLVGAQVNPELPFGDIFPERLDWILQDVIDWVATTGQRLGELVSYWWDRLIGFLANIWEWIYQQASNALNNWWAGIQFNFNWIKDTVFEIWNKMWTLGTEIYHNVSQALEGVGNYIIGTIIPFFQQLPGQIWSVLQTGFAIVTGAVSNGLSWLGDRLGEIGQNIGRFFDEQLQHLINFWNGFTANFGEWMGNIGNFFINLLPNIDKIPGLVLSGIEDIAKSLGKGISDWLENDLHDSVRDIEGAEDIEHLPKGTPVHVLILGFIAAALSKLAPWILRVGLPQLGNLLKSALPFLFVLTLESTGEMDKLVEKYVVPAFNDVLGFFEGLGPMAPQAGSSIAVPLAKTLQVTIDGLATFCFAGGMLGFLKQAGLGQVAAMIYDLINFKTLTASFMTALATVYIARPVEYYYNSLARPYIPGMGQLSQMAAERVINQVTFMQLGRFHGYSDDYLTKFFDVSMQPARYFALRGMAESGSYDEEYFTKELRHSGYNDDTVTQLLAMLKRYSLGDVKGIMVGAATKRYRYGFSSEGDLRTELQTLGAPKSLLDHYVFAANLDYQTDYAADLLTAYQTQYNKSMIDESTFRGQLSGLGLSSERIEAYVLLEDAKKWKKTAATKVPAAVPEYLTDEGTLMVNTAKEAFRRDLSSAADLYAQLVKLQMPVDLAEAYVEYEIVRKTPKAAA